MSIVRTIQDKTAALWHAMKTSSRFHSVLVFLIFVVIAAVFWLVLALNDNLQNSYTVRIQIVNKPDSVTFITDVPADLHASVRDRGTALLRTAVLKRPVITVNFKDYAADGKFQLSKADINAQLKAAFGATATILSSSLDSVSVQYTTNKGKRVPVIVVADCTPTTGEVLSGAPKAEPSYAVVYGPRTILDTLTRVFTEPVVKRDVSENKVYDVALHPIKGARIVPANVKVSVNVEALVSQSAVVAVKAVGVPEDETILLFPQQVGVDYYLPLSEVGVATSKSFRAEVEYNEAVASRSGKVKVHLSGGPGRVYNARLVTDSVEYTIVR